MGSVAELDVRWRRLSISAKGREAIEAIEAIRTPLFVLLIVNAAAVMVAVATMVERPDWSAVKELLTAWMR